MATKLINDARRLPAALARLLAYSSAVRARIARVRAMGTVEAVEHWREGKYLVLVSPMRAGVRERKFIGSDPANIRAARAKIARHAEVLALLSALHGAEALQRRVNDSLAAVHADLRPGQYERHVKPWDKK